MTQAIDDATRVHGSWRLVSFLEQRADGGWEPPLGEGAHGYVSYWPNGRMQVVIGSDDRPRLRGEWSQVPAQDKAVCLDRMVAYGGRYRVEGSRVLHEVDTCWIPNWEGRELVREVSFPGADQLLLTTLPDLGPPARPTQRVLWERVT